MGKINWQEGRGRPWPKQQGKNSLVLPVALPCTHGQPPWGKSLGLCNCLNSRRATPSALRLACRRNAATITKELWAAKAQGSVLSTVNSFMHMLKASLPGTQPSAKGCHCFPSYRELSWAIRYSKQLFLPCLCTLPGTHDAMVACDVRKSGGRSSLHKKVVSIAEREQQLFLSSWRTLKRLGLIIAKEQVTGNSENFHDYLSGTRKCASLTFCKKQCRPESLVRVLLALTFFLEV